MLTLRHVVLLCRRVTVEVLQTFVVSVFRLGVIPKHKKPCFLEAIDAPCTNGAHLILQEMHNK